MLQVCALLCLTLLPACLALPSPAEERPRPYQYQYGVEDKNTNNNFHKSESQDGAGGVLGSFVISLPDGRIQTTQYKVTKPSIFNANNSSKYCVLI